MTVENISWSISTTECWRTHRGSNPRPPDLQSDAHPTEPPRPAYPPVFAIYYWETRGTYYIDVLGYLNQRTTKPTIRPVWPAKTEICLYIHPYSKGSRLSLFDITKTCLYKFDPLQPHFYIVKLGFAGVYIIFLILLNNIDCGYSLEPPRRGGSNEYPQSMFWAEIWKNIGVFIWNFLVFGDVIFYIFE